MLRKLVIGVVFVCSLNSFAKSGQPPSDNAVKDQLLEEVSDNHHAVGYSQARKDLLGHMAIRQDGNKYVVRDVYCESDYASPGLGKVPNNSVINVEHTWPQSKFGGNGSRGEQKSDLHHLYPTDSQLNSIRGNYPFGIVVNETKKTKCPQSKIGYDLNGQRVFEPPQAHKGNVARALFYFAVRYQMKIRTSEEEVLRQWHQEDPADQEEMTRNDQVEDFQGNRNPFIDQPQLVNVIADF